MIGIRILKICGKSICRPLELIFNECISNGIFPSEWKKVNVVPIHKKNDRQCFENYRPISLLPICDKILERLIFDEMFPFFIKNGLISQISQVLNLEILVLTNFCLLRMRYTYGSGMGVIWGWYTTIHAR